MSNIYYVYAYVRTDGTPYYIGKGKGNRCYDKHKVPIPPRERIIFLETNLTNLGACAIERRLIRWWGRKDIGTGILRNQTDGGDGGDTSKCKAWIDAYEKRKQCNGFKGFNTGPRGPDLLETRLKKKHSQTGMKVWNNGVLTKRCKLCPGDGWVLGRLDRNPNAIAIVYKNKQYPSIQKAKEDTGACFGTIKKYSKPIEPYQAQFPAP